MKNYIYELKESGELSLLKVGNSNWDYYLKVNTKHVYSVPKPDKSSCLPSYFGDLDYFNIFLSLTEKGET